MDKVIFYRNDTNVRGLDRRNRFIDYQSLERYLDRFEPYYVENIEGCIITESTGYFDVKSSFNKYIFFSTCSYISIEQHGSQVDEQNQTQSFKERLLCFVDKVEQNNFSYKGDRTESYYRVYFSIDWWSTLLYNGVDLKSYIYGQTYRGHINDVRKSIVNPQAPAFIADLSNTYGTEEVPTQMEIKTRRIPSENPDLSWAYIITSATNEYGNFKNFPQIITLVDRETSCTSPIAVVPVKDGMIVPYYYVRTKVDGEDVTDKPLEAIFTSVTMIKDSEVLGIFYSSIPPSKIEERTFTNPLTGEEVERIVVTGKGNRTGNYYLITDGENNYANYTYQLDSFGARPLLDTFIPTKIEGLRISMNDVYNDLGIQSGGYFNLFTKPTTYAEYLNNITKYYSSAYTPLMLRSSGAYCLIDPMFKDESCWYVEVTLSLQNGGVYAYNPTILATDLSSCTICVGTNTIFQPSKIVDKLDVAQSITNGFIKVATGTAKTVGGFKENPVKGVASAFSTVGALADAVFSVADARRGIDTGSPSPQEHDYTITEVEFEYYVPANKEEILEKLALYGYYTDLQPKDILINHRRKYFNYIQTSNCYVNYGDLTEEIRKDIQDMFNSGVWLWSSYLEIGNYKTPNYPIIMDEV